MKLQKYYIEITEDNAMEVAIDNILQVKQNNVSKLSGLKNRSFYFPYSDFNSLKIGKL